MFFLFHVAAIAPLAAQRDIVKRELDELASPAAIDRTRAVTRLVAIKEDIAADLRVAYKFADLQQRLGLLLATQLRGEDALVQQAAEALGDADERLVGHAREYLLCLSFESLKPTLDDFSAEQQECWDRFFTLRIRRDICAVLFDAQILPGKYAGQFDSLRRFDSPRVDRELLAILAASPALAEAMNIASLEAIQRDVPPERAFQIPWRKLQIAAGAFQPAIGYLQRMNAGDEVNRGIALHGKTAWLAALEVAGGLRCAAVGALAESANSPELALLLNAYYEELMTQAPAQEFATVVNLDDLRTEIELALARFGDDNLLTARIEALRGQIDRVNEARANVNMQVASRPDLLAQNQIAHLLLRAGRAEAADKEWTDAANRALEMLGNADGRNRSSLSSYLAAVYYNLACAQSLQSKVTRSLASLREAVRYGYKDFGWMLEDGDLGAVRACDDFRDWFVDTAPPGIADRLPR